MPEPTITLKNRTKRLLVLNLPHAVVPEAATMTVVGTRSHDATPVKGPKDASAPGAGVRAVVAHKRPVSGSVTLTAKGCPEKGDVASGLPWSARLAPDVVRAKAAGDVEVVEVPAGSPEPPPASGGDRKTPEAGGEKTTSGKAAKRGAKEE